MGHLFIRTGKFALIVRSTAETQKKNSMQPILFIAGAIVFVIGVNVWAADKDMEINASAASYESCVKQQYNMTPQQWYEQHGQYPLCGN